MDVQDAVRLAKDYVRRVYAEEDIKNVGLEEIKLETMDVWRITIGFSRPWEKQAGFSTTLVPPFRSFKTVAIDDKSGAVISMDAREMKLPAR